MAKTSFVPSPVKIKVLGIGGGGCNAISRMVKSGIKGVEFIAMNTDAQALAITEAPIRLQLGERLTKGLGAGGDHILGQKAAEETRDELRQLISGADMVFIASGMGGGTGTGGAPVAAEIARQSGALTIAIVTKPFTFEGAHRSRVAGEGIINLIRKVDTLIVIPNDRLLVLCDQKTSIDGAFKLADDVLYHGVQAICQVITVPGFINLDFADVKTVMKNAGPAWISIGTGSGKNRAVDAAKEALASPLLDVSIRGSQAVLFNVVGGSNLTLFEVSEAAKVIKQTVDPEANIIFGVTYDPFIDNEVRITLIATGFVSKSALVESSDEFTQRLKDLKGEEELDFPSFLRRPLFNQRRQILTPSPEVIPAPSQIPTHQSIPADSK